ncbi:hypothetical protein DFH94DRAFT_748426 [Russula ochroleuca]|uniref:Cytochrome b561 domain-containing protein n=1 Tax=Russula ochroleuca TaxID=152965 RepID=A0A9P5MUM9_9AGAM|nr:hypothetical protein DFH94DRAFT_748426 [Russula ochroleuca]
MASADEPLSASLDAPTDPLMGNNSQHLSDESRPGDRLTFYTALASALVLLLSTWSIILSSNPGGLSWFAFHPTLNSLAVLCFTYGILTLQPTSQPITKAAGLQRHQIAMLTGLLSILLGTSAMLTYKASHGAPHFTTWHSTFGLITVSWLIVQAAVGAGSVWFGGAAFGGGHKAKLVWKYHRLSGYILLLSLLTTVNFGGAWSTWVSAHSAYGVRLVAYTLAPLGILVSLYTRIRPSKMKFF